MIRHRASRRKPRMPTAVSCGVQYAIAVGGLPRCRHRTGGRRLSRSPTRTGRSAFSFRSRPAAAPMRWRARCSRRWRKFWASRWWSRTGPAPAARWASTRSRRPPPDGYTIGLAGAGALGVNIGERTKRMYDPAKDLAPISRAAESPFILVATPALNASTLARRGQARQGRAQPHVDRPRRQRHGDAARRHDVRHHGRCENQPGALSRHRAGGDRRDRRPRPARHRRSAAVDGRHRRRQAQGGRGLLEAALLRCFPMCRPSRNSA